MFSKEVDLAGYAIPHPLENKMNLRVQTHGSKTANEALRDGLNSLIELCEDTEQRFKKALKSKKGKKK